MSILFGRRESPFSKYIIPLLNKSEATIIQQNDNNKPIKLNKT